MQNRLAMKEHFRARVWKWGFNLRASPKRWTKLTAPHRARRSEAGMPARRRTEAKMARTKICKTSLSRDESQASR